MKKIICLILIIVCIPCFGAIKQNGVAINNNYYDNTIALQNEISRLENELEQKTARLNQCAEKNQNFKIAGIAAVGLTGVGVATNISKYSKMREQEKTGEKIVKNIENEQEKVKNINENLNMDCVKRKISTELTFEERKRLSEIGEEVLKNSSLYLSTFQASGSDGELLKKFMQIKRECQKSTTE